MRVLKYEELSTYQDRVISVVMGDRRRPWFNIVEVTEACQVLGIKDFHKDPTYELLQSLHCCDYSAMSDELRAMIPQAIRDVLTPKEKIQPIGFIRNLFNWKEQA